MMTTRRSFVAGVSAATLWPLGGLLGGPAAHAGAGRRHLFLTVSEARMLEAACARLLADAGGGNDAAKSGAAGTKSVVYYIDRQLASAWGNGAQVYRSGPWQPGALPALRLLTPAEVFKTALSAIERDGCKSRAPFAALTPAAQDRFLQALAENRIDLGKVASAQFFEMLLQMTVEGHFTLVGIDRDRLRWRMIGFPGAYATAL